MPFLKLQNKLGRSLLASDNLNFIFCLTEPFPGTSVNKAVALSAFVFSVVMTYLLLALYRSFIYPLVIIATVPMGLTGALLSLVVVNWLPGVIVLLDMITSLGFLILTDVVANNSILVAKQALQLQDEGQKYDESILTLPVIASDQSLCPLAPLFWVWCRWR